MNVGLIYQIQQAGKPVRILCEVVEWPEGKSEKQVLEAWCFANGLGTSPETLAKYFGSLAPVKSWASMEAARG